MMQWDGVGEEQEEKEDAVAEQKGDKCNFPVHIFDCLVTRQEI